MIFFKTFFHNLSKWAFWRKATATQKNCIWIYLTLPTNYTVTKCIQKQSGKKYVLKLNTQLFRTFKDEAGGSIDFYFCQWLALWQKGQTCISPILMDLQYQWYTVDMIPSITLIWYSLFHGFSVKKENSPVKCWTNKYFCTAVGTKTKALWKTVTKIALLSLITVNFPLRRLIPSLQGRLVISVFNCKHFRIYAEVSRMSF